MTGVAKKTVMRLLVEVGEVCESYQDRALRNLPCRLVQLDELWGFNYCKAKNITPTIAEKIPGAGDRLAVGCNRRGNEIGSLLASRRT